MKNFKVLVSEGEVDFFKALLNKFDFVQYEQVESFAEPRVYPAADFEIRSVKDSSVQGKEERGIPNVNRKIEDEESKKDAMSDIRNVISQIDKMRDRSK